LRSLIDLLDVSQESPKAGKSGKSSKEGQDIIESECYCLRAGATELEITTEKY